MSSKLIALDAGHGLRTAGKQTPDGVKEWSLNDKVCDKVTEILAAYDCKIIRTDNDEGNVDESLASRVEKYLNSDVDAVVSIHHNAYKSVWSSATGVEAYTDRNASADDKRLAECIYNRLVINVGLKGRGIKTANFQVINQNKIPAVLIEGGFMDGKNDYKVITSDEGQTAYAKAVAEGLIEFLGLTKKATENKVTVFANVLEWQCAAIADGYKFPKYGADGEWGSECESVATKAICKRCYYPWKNKNLTKLIQKAVGVTADGKFGADTKKAVIEYQKKHGLVADGIVGIKTWKVILGIR